jgi:predicted AAA+ superfamily ATPase
LDHLQKPAVILDEIQYVLELLQYIKLRIDQNHEQNGCWILTGSQQFRLMGKVSESLAGRIAILELLPFSILEVKSGGIMDLSSLLWYGRYPESILSTEENKRNLWIRSYIQTYVERDLRQLHNVHDLNTFERFVSLMATRHSQLLNIAEISREVGVSAPSVKSWSTLLEAAYICYFLPPYFKNYGKRLTKSLKVYFIGYSSFFNSSAKY